MLHHNLNINSLYIYIYNKILNIFVVIILKWGVLNTLAVSSTIEKTVCSENQDKVSTTNTQDVELTPNFIEILIRTLRGVPGKKPPNCWREGELIIVEDL